MIFENRNNLYWSELPAIRQNKNMLDELKSIAYINIIIPTILVIKDAA